MTKAKTLLSVRLDPTLAESLDEYCAATGRTRSTVVQEGVAEYLVSRSGPTLHSLAEAVLPALPKTEANKEPKRAARQQRYRDYARAKHRR
jgi:predicted DNA-binding protein